MPCRPRASLPPAFHWLPGCRMCCLRWRQMAATSSVLRLLWHSCPPCCMPQVGRQAASFAMKQALSQTVIRHSVMLAS